MLSLYLKLQITIFALLCMNFFFSHLNAFDKSLSHNSGFFYSNCNQLNINPELSQLKYRELNLHPESINSEKQYFTNRVIKTSSNFYNLIGESSDSSSTKNSNIFPAALIGSVILGISGAYIGYQTKTECAGSSDVLRICSGDGHYAKVGATIGGISGTIIGYLSRRKEIKQRKPFFRHHREYCRRSGRVFTFRCILWNKHIGSAPGCRSYCFASLTRERAAGFNV